MKKYLRYVMLLIAGQYINARQAKLNFDAIKDKIMQPFFTTKPTGECTGLGLSLTYDMLVKGHGGNIHINSIEGESSEFIVSLPIII